MPAGTRSQAWPRHVAEDNSIEDLLETYRLLLPEQEETPVVFGMPERDVDLEQTNAYAATMARPDTGAPTTSPWSHSPRYNSPCRKLSRPAPPTCSSLEKRSIRALWLWRTPGQPV
ncbi:MAG: hypothetical protein A2W33_07000 [Chloroflexi bacterium RBG_16_52_11]|nr:MAG: hypothetical protein A2W33_07000 [Chloroflexi bacterium RBG_16_52_11]